MKKQNKEKKKILRKQKKKKQKKTKHAGGKRKGNKVRKNKIKNKIKNIRTYVGESKSVFGSLPRLAGTPVQPARPDLASAC